MIITSVITSINNSLICSVWQHVDCMEIDRKNIPDEYLCEACEPRMIDRFKARALQIRRRQEIKAHLAR